MSGRMEVSLHVDHERDVVSIAFFPSGGDGVEGTGRRRHRHLRAVRMEQLAPNLVAKYDTAGRLVGIDLFNASTLLGMDAGAGFNVSVKTSHAGQAPPRGRGPAPRGGASSVSPSLLPGRGQGPAGAGKAVTTPETGLEVDGKDGKEREADAAPVRTPGGAAIPGGRPGFWARLRARVTGRRTCPHCRGLYDPGQLKFKRFLTRQEAERMEGVEKLRSHFVYGCPHCRGDLLDT